MHARGAHSENKITTDEAELISLKALGFLAQDDHRLARFLDLTGLAPESLTGRAHDPDFLAEILNYLLTDETLLLVFCSNEGVNPAKVAPAKRILAGEDGSKCSRD
jgi:hypothetical protein